MGRLTIDRPPIIAPGIAVHTDPLPQSLELTAIVISFGMNSLIVVIALRGFLESGSDRADLSSAPAPDADRRREHRASAKRTRWPT
jgi:multicomponent K+:H+ antiporter subunit C